MRHPSLLACSATALLTLTACGTSQPGGAPVTFTASPTVAASSPSKSPSPTEELGACNQPVSAEKELKTAPLVNKWESWGTAQHPVSTEYGGEHQAENGTPVCFKHSPAGALFAASTYFGAILSPQEFKNASLDRAYPVSQGEEFYENFAEAAAEAYATLNEAEFIVRGYKLEKYSPEAANFSLAIGLAGIEDRFMLVETPLIWKKNDWYIDTSQADLATLISNDAKLLTSLEGYTPWGPTTMPTTGRR